MAKSNGLGAELFIGGYRLSPDTAEFNISTPVGQIDVTDITLLAHARLAGYVDGKVTFKCFFNPRASDSSSADAAHVALSGLPTADVIITALPIGPTAGYPAFWFTAKQVTYDPVRGADGSLLFTVECVLANGVIPEWGDLATAGMVTHASATSSASIDDAASSSAGVAAVAHLCGLASGTVDTLVLEHSSDNSTFATKATVKSSYAGGHDAARVTASSTVNRYLRATTTGTFSNASFVMARRRGTSVDRVGY